MNIYISKFDEVDMLFLFISIAIIIVIIGAAIIIKYRNKARSEVEKEILLDSIGGIPSPVDILYAQSYWDNYLEKYTVMEEVDRHTWQNLDMNEVYQRINACQSEPGDILLYKRLRMQASDQEIEQQEKLAAFFSKNPSKATEVMYALKQIGRNKSYTMEILTLEPEVLEVKWKKLIMVLAFVPLFSLLLCFFLPQIGLTLLIVSLFANLIITYLAKAKNYSYQVAYPLSSLVYWSKKILPYIKECTPELANELQECHKICKKIELPFECMRRSDAFESMQIFDFFGLLLLPVISYYYVADFVKKENLCLTKLYDLVGEIDVACSVYSYRKSVLFWCEPQYTNQKELVVESVCHPLVAKPIPNDFETTQCILLTGSNASGKSTFLKSLAVNIILAQSINTSVAEKIRLQHSSVITAMAVSDNIVEGDSYFIAEIKAMKRLVKATENKKFLYLFVDEILRGTNAVERISAGHSFLSFFSTKNVLCFAATHDIELSVMTSPEYAQYHFTEVIINNEITFDYKLCKGESKTKNAIKLLEAQDFPLEIVIKAQENMKQFELKGEWV